MQRPCLIGIAGCSGAGKSELARKVGARLSAPVISLDAYYRDLPHLSLEERARVNYDEPAALDHGLLAAQLARLMDGAEIPVPTYDFSRHLRAAEVKPIRAGKYAILEGLFALYWDDVRQLLGTKVFVELADEICFARRLERDVRERGRSEQSVIEQYAATVRPMSELYVLPTRQYADVVAGGCDDLEHSARAVLAHVEAHLSAARTETAGA